MATNDVYLGNPQPKEGGDTYTIYKEASTRMDQM